MSNDACCKHLHIVYRAMQKPNGSTYGWWECESCHEEMPSIDEIKVLKREHDVLRRRLNLAEARLEDIQETGAIRSYHTDWYDVRELLVECLEALDRLKDTLGIGDKERTEK
jgi:hypothetical protein